MFLDDVEIPNETTNIYYLRSLLNYGTSSKIVVKLPTGEVYEKTIDTRNTLTPHKDDVELTGVIEETKFNIFDTVTHDGTLLNGNMLSIEVNGTDSYIKAYNIFNNNTGMSTLAMNGEILNTYVIDDSRVSFVVLEDDIKTLRVYEYYNSPLTFREVLNIELVYNSNITFLPTIRKFVDIDTDNLKLIGLDGNITLLDTPQLTETGYVSRVSDIYLGYMDSTKLYIYNIESDDWDTAVTLPVELTSETITYMLNTSYGVLIFTAEGSVFKFLTSTIELTKLDITITDLEVIMNNKSDIYFKTTVDEKIYKLL